MQHFGGVWGEVSAWALVLAGLASLACIITLIGRRARMRPRTSAEVAPLDRGREWDLVMRQAAQDFSRGDALAALQARSALKIEAAEHAYNRLVADCSALCRAAEEPANDPASPPIGSEPAPLASAPAETPEQTPLAA